MKPLLDAVLARAGADGGRGLSADPLVAVRRFAAPADREAAAWIAALLAYGRVASILRALDAVFRRMPAGPAAFLAAAADDPAGAARRLDGFVHRFTRGEDLARVLAAAGRLAAGAGGGGGVEAAFLACDDRGAVDVSGALARFTGALRERLPPPPAGPDAAARERSVRFLLPTFGGGSAAKRLCLFLRWMARPDDGLDLGLWPSLSPARLVVPLDTHVFRIAGYLGMTDRRAPDARAALEITAGLRALDARDPLRYDFALSHLGILGDCPSRPVPDVCAPCPLRPACRCWSAPSRPSAPSRWRPTPAAAGPGRPGAPRTRSRTPSPPPGPCPSRSSAGPG